MNFPKTIYVKIEPERDPENDYIVCSEDYCCLSKGEGTVQIAVYDLVTVKNAVNKTELVD
jgi:hypothetical protein